MRYSCCSHSAVQCSCSIKRRWTEPLSESSKFYSPFSEIKPKQSETLTAPWAAKVCLKYPSDNWNSVAKHCIILQNTAVYSDDKSRSLSRLRVVGGSIFFDYFYNSIKTKCKLPFTSFKNAQSWKVSLSLLRNSLTIRPNQEIDLSGRDQRCIQLDQKIESV